MLKILQARLQQYMNCELPDVHAEFSRGTRDQIANIRWIIKKESSRKTSAVDHRIIKLTLKRERLM